MGVLTPTERKKLAAERGRGKRGERKGSKGNERAEGMQGKLLRTKEKQDFLKKISKKRFALFESFEKKGF